MEKPRSVICMWLCTLLCLLGTITVVVDPVLATTYYVKPTGSDAANGRSEAAAWQHLNKACTTLVAGDTVFIRAGTYNETSWRNTSCWGYTLQAGFVPKNAGTPGNYIVFKGYPGDAAPVIVGVSNFGTPSTADRMAASFRNGDRYIIYDGLRFHKGKGGIHFPGSGNDIHDIIIRNCTIDSTLGPHSAVDDNSGGILTYVDSYDGGQGDGTPAVRNITVENCNIFANGAWSGAGSPNYRAAGNTAGAHIYGCDSCLFQNNIIHDEAAGIHFKHPARFSEVRGNTFYNIYGAAMWDRHTGNNTIYDYNGTWGIGSIWHHNTVYNSVACFWIGVGSVFSTRRDSLSYFYNNTCDCSGSDTMYVSEHYLAGGVLSQFGFVNRSYFFNNIFYNAPATVYNSSDDAAGAFAWTNTSGYGNPTNIYEDYNMYHGAGSGGNYYMWGSTSYSVSSWRTANPSGVLAGHGANSRYGDPMFENVGARNYQLRTGSPALTGGKGGSFTFFPGSGRAQTISLPTYLGAHGTPGAPDSSISVADAPEVVEGSSLVFPVTIGTTFGATCVITYITLDGTASAPGDFVGVSNGTISIPAGSRSGSIIVSTIDDSEIEGNEMMGVRITNVSIGSVAVSSAIASILDNDAAPSSRILFEQLPGRNLAVSGTYPGYTTAPIADTVINASGGEATTWASDENNTVPHWVEMVFGQQLNVSGVTVHWAYNSVRSNYTASSQYRIQRWNGSAYVDIVTVNNTSFVQSTETSFSAVTTDRIRIYQPAGQGPTDYSAIMWLTEIQLWGPQDTTPPAPVTDLR